MVVESYPTPSYINFYLLDMLFIMGNGIPFFNPRIVRDICVSVTSHKGRTSFPFTFLIFVLFFKLETLVRFSVETCFRTLLGFRTRTKHPTVGVFPSLFLSLVVSRSFLSTPSCYAGHYADVTSTRNYSVNRTLLIYLT